MQCKVEDFILSSRALSSPCLDLSKKAISDLPEEMVGCEHLEVCGPGECSLSLCTEMISQFVLFFLPVSLSGGQSANESACIPVLFLPQSALAGPAKQPPHSPTTLHTYPQVPYARNVLSRYF